MRGGVVDEACVLDGGVGGVDADCAGFDDDLVWFWGGGGGGLDGEGVGFVGGLVGGFVGGHGGWGGGGSGWVRWMLTGCENAVRLFLFEERSERLIAAQWDDLRCRE